MQRRSGYLKKDLAPVHRTRFFSRRSSVLCLVKSRPTQISLCDHTYLCEPNISRLLPEALAADVEPVFANQASLVCADAARTSVSIWHTVLSSLSLSMLQTCIYSIFLCTYHPLAPFPKVRGREYQTFSCAILVSCRRLCGSRLGSSDERQIECDTWDVVAVPLGSVWRANRLSVAVEVLLCST